MKYSFTVASLPPKKDGSSSMWNKETEVLRLIALRDTACKAFNGNPPLEKNINLTLAVYIPDNNPQVGDLDNFITGVCDGLMARNSRANISSKFHEPDLQHISPDKSIGIVDDREILSITAKKIIGQHKKTYYEVTLEGER